MMVAIGKIVFVVNTTRSTLQKNICKEGNMNELPEKGAVIQMPVQKALSSYWPGVWWIICGVVVEIIGRVVAASAVESARGLPMGNALNILNQAASIRGFSDLIMLVLIAIGVFQLVRSYRQRSKLKANNSG
jgi:hypothetical protein